MTKEELLAMTPEKRAALAPVDVSVATINDCLGGVSCVSCVGCLGCVDCANCVDCFRCFRCVDCEACSDSHYCWECIGIQNGHAMRFVAYGVQLTSSEFREMVKS